jgi:hypothetical protein
LALPKSVEIDNLSLKQGRHPVDVGLGRSEVSKDTTPFDELYKGELNSMSNDAKHDRELRTDAVDFSFGEIVNLHKDKEIIISPEYQRLFRWEDAQKSRLVESILVQLPIPPIFLVENDDGILELIDGLQRVSSVIQFISPGDIDREPLRLIGCDLMKELNGKVFEDLPLADRLRIKRTPIRAIIIKKQGDTYIKYELFKRLNTGGSLLSAQEIRNCSSRMVEGGEEFYKLIQGFAQYPPFKVAIGRLPENALMQKGDEELVLRFFAIKNFLHGYHGNVQEWLDSYMESVLFKESEFEIPQERESFQKIFQLLSEKFGLDAFARYRDGLAQGRLAPAYFEAVIGGALSNVDAIAKKSPNTKSLKV